MSDEKVLPVAFDTLLDAVDATCEWCDREGRVDRWAVRDAEKYDETLVCEECADRGHALPKVEGVIIHYRGYVFPTMDLPTRFYGEQVTRELRREIAEVLDEKLEKEGKP